MGSTSISDRTVHLSVSCQKSNRGYYMAVQRHEISLQVWNRVFSRDVMAAMLVFLNNGTAAMLVSPTNPPGN